MYYVTGLSADCDSPPLKTVTDEKGITVNFTLSNYSQTKHKMQTIRIDKCSKGNITWFDLINKIIL